MRIATAIRVVTLVQAALFLALASFALFVAVLGVSFATVDTPFTHDDRGYVVRVVVFALLAVLVPTAIFTALASGAAELRRRPRRARIVLLGTEVASSVILLWPQVFHLTSAVDTVSGLVLIDLMLSGPAIALLVIAMLSATEPRVPEAARPPSAGLGSIGDPARRRH